MLRWSCPAIPQHAHWIPSLPQYLKDFLPFISFIINGYIASGHVHLHSRQWGLLPSWPMSFLSFLSKILMRHGIWNQHSMIPTWRDGRIRWNGGDPHLLHADSPLVSCRVHCWVLFYNTSIPALLVRCGAGGHGQTSAANGQEARWSSK